MCIYQQTKKKPIEIQTENGNNKKLVIEFGIEISIENISEMKGDKKKIKRKHYVRLFSCTIQTDSES